MAVTTGIILVILVGIISTAYCIARPETYKRAAISVTLIAILLTGGCGGPADGGGNNQQGQDGQQLEVHFIDVGQGDSILVKNGSNAMLIDTGTNNNSIRLQKYIEQQGIKKLDYAIGTNPLKDHIGGMSDLIDNYDISRIILPQINCINSTHKDLQMNMLAKFIKPIYPEPGKIYPLGDASFTILAPSSNSYEALADYSIVIKLVYGQTSFLFTGDAGKISEQEMLDRQFDLSADVLKLGRHGSSSSTMDEFLQAVNPDSAVISVGKDNPYLHPHMETMLKLNENNIAVYRTDEQSSIVAVSDGNNITFCVEPGSYTWPEIMLNETIREGAAEQDVPDKEQLQKPVFVNENNSRYHTAGCSFLEDKCVEITLEEAIEAGYAPCLLCKP
ncbi:come-like protein, metallo beta-lactamase superfamily hydrolase, secreted [hydrocarbon metagenome]|uniref:Come-like protein, metallo beta-lactamase superfamily hydrolase, secreted n=1 Tax=hydrocarbon metagenome TaxID=938273 RepID=A0A0W8E1Y3_9ZZZZ